MLTGLDRIEGPPAADDGGRLLCVVARPRDELKAVEDGSRRERLPQSRFVFVFLTNKAINSTFTSCRKPRDSHRQFNIIFASSQKLADSPVSHYKRGPGIFLEILNISGSSSLKSILTFKISLKNKKIICYANSNFV